MTHPRLSFCKDPRGVRFLQSDDIAFKVRGSLREDNGGDRCHLLINQSDRRANKA